MNQTTTSLNNTKWPFFTSIYSIVSTLVIISLTLQIVKRSKSSNKPKLPPGPIAFPLIGSVIQLIVNKPQFRWVLKVLADHNDNIACIRMGKVNVIVVGCAKIARDMFKTQDAVFALRPVSFASTMYSHGSSISPFGNEWMKGRKILMSEIVSESRMQMLHDKRTEEADNLVKYIYNLWKKDLKEVDIRHVSRFYIGNTIRKMMFNNGFFGDGNSDGGPGKEEIEHVDALFLALSYFFSFSISDYFPWLNGFDVDGHKKFVKQTKAIADKYHDPIIEERIQQWRNKGVDHNKKVEDLIDVLTALKDEDGNPLLTLEQIKGTTMEIMVATVDNPTNAVEWALAEMLNKPEILHRAVDEIDKVVGKERLVQESDIPNLNYTKSCLREAFRIHTINPFSIPHVALRETTVAGNLIPKGSHILLSRYSLGRNPKVWENPLEFRPERHMDECEVVTLNEHDLRFISFGTGRRGCVASSLGSSMTIMLLARLLQGFSWSRSCPVVLDEANNSLFLANPLTASVEPRLSRHLYMSTS